MRFYRGVVIASWTIMPLTFISTQNHKKNIQNNKYSESRFDPKFDEAIATNTFIPALAPHGDMTVAIVSAMLNGSNKWQLCSKGDNFLKK